MIDFADGYLYGHYGLKMDLRKAPLQVSYLGGKVSRFPKPNSIRFTSGYTRDYCASLK